MYYPRLHYPNPVTRLPVQYPPGVAATVEGQDSKQSSLSLAAVPSPPKNVKEFTSRLAELERQINSSIAYDAAENLVNAHGYYLDDSRNDALQEIFSGALDRRSLSNVEAGNSLTINQTVQPVIQLAPDGKSATIRARLLRVGGTASGLAGGTYEGRAINRGDGWKLQSFTLKEAWSSPFSHWAPVVERRR